MEGKCFPCRFSHNPLVFNTWDLIKLKNFCIVRETINKTKRQPTDWEKNICKWCNWQGIHFQSKQTAHTVQYQKIKQSNWKSAVDLNRHFSKEDILLANRHMKRCSILLIIREIQIKTTKRYHLTLVRMAAIKKSADNKCWRGCGENRTIWHCWWECKLVQLQWKIISRFFKKLKLDPAIPLLGIYPEKMKTLIWKDTHTPKSLQSYLQ